MEIYELIENGQSWLQAKGFYITPEKLEEFYSSLQNDELKLFKRICSQLPCAAAYMKENASEYGWTEEVLADATMFVPQELPRPVPYFKKPWHCFENSFEHARKTGLLYVEGLAINPTGPQIHAWNSTDGTDVIDLTWPFQHVNKYFGLVFDVEKLTMAGYPFGAYFGHLYDRLKKQRAQSGQV